MSERPDGHTVHFVKKKETGMIPWTVDPVPDANGFATIRPADGTETGDVAAQPIAVVYRAEDAERIMSALRKAAALEVLLAALEKERPAREISRAVATPEARERWLEADKRLLEAMLEATKALEDPE